MGFFEELLELNKVEESDRAVFQKYPSIGHQVNKADQRLRNWEKWKADNWDEDLGMTHKAAALLDAKDDEIAALRLLHEKNDAEITSQDAEIASLEEELASLRLERDILALRAENASLRAAASFDAIFKSADEGDREVLKKYPQIRMTLEDVENLRASGEKQPTAIDPSENHTLEDPHTKQPKCSRGLSRVIGMAELKNVLMQDVIGPLRDDPEAYRRYRVPLPNGILFYGPPGCGKTYIAESLAEELGYFFQCWRMSDIASIYIHETVSKIRDLFESAIDKAPSVLFIDEFEAFAPARSGLGGHQHYKAEEVNEFLKNLEACAERRVLVIAATNEPDKIDPAICRSGRFDKRIMIPPPDGDARRAMIEFYLDGRPADSSLNAGEVASMLDGYSSSDIKLLVDEAARLALAAKSRISMATMLAASKRVTRSIRQRDLQKYSLFQSRGI